MSLSRALTVIRSRKVSDTAPGQSRSLTLKRTAGTGTIRHKISAPMELISTTNMISYNAPNIAPPAIASSRSDSGDSDMSLVDFSTPVTSPDSSSTELSSSPGPKPNHLSCYFGSAISGDEAPSIPQRAPSHTKSSDSIETLGRKRSKYFRFPSREIKPMARSSIVMFSPEIETISDHVPSIQELPYSELEQAQESSPPATHHVEESNLTSRNFYTFRAEDYIWEIDEIYRLIFGDELDSTLNFRA
ncbi:hypothetical protein GcM1_242047 [Golovinomyces cichoracearum]|uniref:Uncharacterized protein n=1 Tax=Golovinomyces cichoracearum TaxID=62708 RepID=A0A420IGY1_9PEZI|nr:hypothetical protein GcM1_242047 [Golovinomyces cichoracearum]